MPRGAYIWEVQSEMTPSARLLRLAAASQLRHRLAIVPKPSGDPSDVQRAELFTRLARSILAAVQEAHSPRLNAAASPAVAAPSPVPALIPKLILPAAAEGFFNHAGDSFRELAELWAERGYVSLERNATAAQVWLNGVGDTLLYDRPTLEWLRAAPPTEGRWKRALFGNPAPPKGEGVSPWMFWPRRPRLVEKLVTLGIPEQRGWEDRRAGLVFYGKAENKVQESRRGGDWSAACEVWSMPKGSEPYPFTQEEYLVNLSQSRFGLCLAGFGLKCHREVECMAMGCVPVCATDVDMTNYADPPKEGEHYLRAATPEEAKKLVEAVPKEQWEAMSAAGRAWWARNASVEGSWELTRRLVGL